MQPSNLRRAVALAFAVLFAVAVCLAPLTLARAEPGPGPAAVGHVPAYTLPSAPAPIPIPAYVSPLTLIDDGMPTGTVRTLAVDGAEWVAYDRHAHTRLLLVFTLAERVSDDRAREAWRDGWAGGIEAMLPALEAERVAHAHTAAASNRDPGLAESVAKTSWIIAGAFAAGIALGVVAGAYASAQR